MISGVSHDVQELVLKVGEPHTVIGVTSVLQNKETINTIKLDNIVSMVMLV